MQRKSKKRTYIEVNSDDSDNQQPHLEKIRLLGKGSFGEV